MIPIYTTEIASSPSILDEECPVDSIINYSHILLFISNSMAFLTTIMVCWSLFQNFKKLTKLNTSLKWLFCISILSTWLCIVPAILIFVFCYYSMVLASSICILISICGYLLLFLSLLATLLTRLSETFSNSIYEISATQRKSFILVYLLLILLSLTTATLTAIQLGKGQNNNNWALMMLCVNGFLYLLAAIWTVYIFTKKLLKLTQSQARTLHNVLTMENNKFFSQQQLKLITSITKYVGLFSIAAITSIISIVLIFIGYLFNKPLQHHGEWTLVLVGIDCMINIICLYLQYSFSIKYYQMFCKYLHLCVHKIIEKHLRWSIKKKYLENRRKLNPIIEKQTNIKIHNHEMENLKSHSEVEEDGYVDEEDNNTTI